MQCNCDAVYLIWPGFGSASLFCLQVESEQYLPLSNPRRLLNPNTRYRQIGILDNFLQMEGTYANNGYAIHFHIAP